MKAKFLALVAAFAPLALVSSADAHHSFQMFALDKLETVNGTVESFKWAMPHTWINVVIPGKAGGPPEKWGFEGHAPNLMARKGWKFNTLKAGDNVTILMHPMKDGTNAGSIVHVTLASGQQLWNADSLSAP
jgi:hypothetical protein